jgi:hypothetical protein
MVEQRHKNLLQWPARLADGLGLKELPRSLDATCTPKIGSPALLIEGDSAMSYAMGKRFGQSTEASFCNCDESMSDSDNNGTWGTRIPQWTLVTSHGLALLYVAAHPDATVKQIAQALELTERRVADILRELAAAQLLLVKRSGRRNQYEINPNARFRHPLVADIPFRGFIRLWRWSSRPGVHEEERNP